MIRDASIEMLSSVKGSYHLPRVCQLSTADSTNIAINLHTWYHLHAMYWITIFPHLLPYLLDAYQAVKLFYSIL